MWETVAARWWTKEEWCSESTPPSFLADRLKVWASPLPQTRPESRLELCSPLTADSCAQCQLGAFGKHPLCVSRASNRGCRQPSEVDLTSDPLRPSARRLRYSQLPVEWPAGSEPVDALLGAR